MTLLTEHKQLACAVNNGVEYQVQCRTGCLKLYSFGFWEKFRSLLKEKKVDPLRCVLCQIYQDGTDEFRGVLVSSELEVTEFLLFYSNEEISASHFSVWRTLRTDSREYRSWQSEIQFGIEIVEAANILSSE